MSEKLEITLFGNPMLLKQGQPLTGFVSNKAPALVYYLVTTGQTHSRNLLANLLWGDFTETKAKKNLRDVLSSLRTVMGEHLLITRQSVAFNRQLPYELDIEVFAKSVAVGNKTETLPGAAIGLLQTAADLYKGDFLEGFYVPQAAVFEEWMRRERSRFHQQASQFLHQLTRHFAEQKQYMSGVVYVSRLLAMEPWREDAHRQLMQLLAWSGQRTAALAQYETCKQVLADEFGVEPELRTVQLYERIRAGDISLTPVGDVEQFGRKTAVSNLPVPLTHFVGREAELHKIRTMLLDDNYRLLTLVGPGGIGKTRLAIEAARFFVPEMESGEWFKDGLYFVPLAGIETAELKRTLAADDGHHPLAAALADTLDVALTDPENPISRLRNYLREKEMLLVLDNFEHLLLATDFVADLLLYAPHVRLLVTSRTRLNIRGEQILPMRGLPVPISLENPDWRAYGAMQLFAQTARSVDPDFAILPGSETAVMRICRLVNGLPLGIELAATWVRMLSCHEIVHEIETNMRFLESATTDTPERHRSLWAVFSYSWDLLTAEEQRVLCRLAVFRGGFERQAAQDIAQASLGVLASFVDNSLLRRSSAAGGHLRYELLEVLRVYALHRLEEDSEIALATHAQHGYYFMDFLQMREALLLGAEQQTALNDIAVEIQNIRVAWHWAVAQLNMTALGDGLHSLFYYYDMRSRFQEGRDVFVRAVDAVASLGLKTDGERLLWAQLMARLGWFTFHGGLHLEALAFLNRSVDELRPLAAHIDLVFALNYLSAVYLHMSNYDNALAACEESLQLATEIEDKGGMGIALNILSQIAFRRGELEVAQTYGRQSLSVVTALQNRWSLAFSLENLGRVAFAKEQFRQAKEMFQTVLHIREEMGDLRGVAMSLEQLADTAVALDELPRADALYQRSLLVYREIGYQRGMVHVWSHLGEIALARELYGQAEQHFLAALDCARQLEDAPNLAAIEWGLERAKMKGNGRLELRD